MTKDNIEVIFEYEKIQEIVNELLKRYSDLKYSMIVHKNNTDEQHYHIVIIAKTTIQKDTLIKLFPYSDIQPTRNKNGSIQYLIHKNNPEKEQYPKTDIKTNLSEEELEHLFIDTGDNCDIFFLVDKIGKGEIREYQLNEYVTPISHDRYYKKFKPAFDYFIRDYTTKRGSRIMKVIVIQGVTGMGKTTLAKMIAEAQYPSKNGIKNYCEGSASNDPFQDYKGEPVMIINDIRDSTFKLNDLLKLLDNHTNSSIKSRYTNKLFLGDYMILTTTQDINTWYKSELSTSRSEQLEQLYRRINIIYELYPDRQVSTEKIDGEIKVEKLSKNVALEYIHAKNAAEKGAVGTAMSIMLGVMAAYKLTPLTPELIADLDSKGKDAMEKGQIVVKDDNMPF